jgi:biotin carboxyl carrier protein
VIAIKVNVGDVVKSGQEVAVLEAMKMENSIEATQDGTVTAVHVTKGDSIQEGTAIISIG